MATSSTATAASLRIGVDELKKSAARWRVHNGPGRAEPTNMECQQGQNAEGYPGRFKELSGGSWLA